MKHCRQDRVDPTHLQIRSKQGSFINSSWQYWEENVIFHSYLTEWAFADERVYLIAFFPVLSGFDNVIMILVIKAVVVQSPLLLMMWTRVITLLLLSSTLLLSIVYLQICNNYNNNKCKKNTSAQSFDTSIDLIGEPLSRVSWLCLHIVSFLAVPKLNHWSWW